MLWAGRYLPVRIKDKDTNIPLEYADPKIQLQPIKHRSLRVLSKTFRLIVKHIQTFSKTPLIPTYKKQGASSLTRLGFSRYHEAGVSRRPILTSPQTCCYIQNMILQIPHNPPCHNEIQPLPLSDCALAPPWPNWPEIHTHKRDKFTQHIQCTMFRKKDFDDIPHPGSN